MSLPEREAAREIATAARQVVNAPLPLYHLFDDNYQVVGDLKHPWWVAKRNLRATLDTYKDLTGVDGDQDKRQEES